MCGIAGVVSFPGHVDSRVMSRMLKAIQHRGPDDEGMQCIQSQDNIIWLASTRLSILDLSSAGHQPMKDASTGNWIAYNGELYNFREIREELQKAGGVFVSETDTEVVLKAYGLFGSSCVQRFRGMFAFAVWDQSRRELFLCRDRIGEKPLYWSSNENAFAFASEVRALLASGIPERKLDGAGVESFLTNGFLVSPHTMVAGIRGLLPGHWMRVSADRAIIETQKYWTPVSIGPRAKGDRHIELVRERLTESVRLRLVSDAPLGAFLSGGLDSSTVVALMKAAGGQVRTFSVAFDEIEFDESQYSRWVASRFETEHVEVKMTRADFKGIFPSALAAMDQPTFDGINTFCVSRAAREAGLKVALSGTGSDELFGGYELFNWVKAITRLRHFIELVPNPIVRFIQQALSPDAFSGASSVRGLAKVLDMASDGNYGRATERFLMSAYQTSQCLFPSWSRRALRAPGWGRVDGRSWFGLPKDCIEFLSEEIEGDDIENAISKLALRLFLGERCLKDIDFMSMGVSLEVRAPFLDHLLIEDLYRYPGKMRCAGTPDKPFLQQVVRPILGPDYPWRKKRGFLFPFQAWLKEFFDEESAQCVLNDNRLFKDLGLSREGVSLLFKRYRDSEGIPWSRVWAIFVLLNWCKNNLIKQ